MKLLLDTHVFLWWLEDKPLKKEVDQAIRDPNHSIWVSTISILEIVIKKGLGKLRIEKDLVEQLRINRFEHLPLAISHALEVEKIPRLHYDPFDLVLIAQAQCEALTLVTRDRNILRYSVSTLEA